MRKLILIPIILLTLFSCDKDGNAGNNEQVSEINIPDDLAVYINVEIPENTTKEEYILLDNKNRELPINTTENIKTEENTIVSLIRKDTNKTIYIAYILNDNTSNRMSRNSSTSNTRNGVCDNTNVVGVKSTARFILASVLNPISIFHVGNSDKDSFFEIFKSNVLCGTFSDEQILSLENAINQLVDEGRNLTEIAISTAVQTIVEPITGGLFADCWEIGTELILNGQIELDAHPYQDYLISLEEFSSNNPTLPYVIDEFTNVLPNGIIIKDATPLDNDNWKIKFDAYNSLPIPLGVRVGKLQDGTTSIIEPANNETNFFIKSNGSSVIQMIQNGVTCEGFVNNAFDSYYTTVTEGLAIRSSDFDKREVELIFNPQNEYVLFQGPNENISVRIYHIMESLSHIFDIIQIGDKLAEVEEENIKIEILNNILSDADILNDVNSNPTNLKVLQQIIGNQMLLYIEESIEDLVSNELTSLLEQYNIEKSAVSKNLTIIKTALDVIDNINYLDAWSKIDNYTVTVKDYKLHIPSDEIGAVTNPSPDNNSTDVPLSGELTFEPGENTPNDASYKIYFGDTNNPTNFNIINSPNNTYSGTQEGTTYYWKVETLSNSNEVLATSPVWSFTTVSQNNETVTDIDGNVYETIQIGSQTWLKSNMKTTRYRANAFKNFVIMNKISILAG